MGVFPRVLGDTGGLELRRILVAALEPLDRQGREIWVAGAVEDQIGQCPTRGWRETQTAHATAGRDEEAREPRDPAQDRSSVGRHRRCSTTMHGDASVPKHGEAIGHLVDEPAQYAQVEGKVGNLELRR